MTITPQCFGCRHRKGDTLTCTAFPKGIPKPILLGEHDHRTPFPGDGGVRYEPEPEPTPIPKPSPE